MTFQKDDEISEDKKLREVDYDFSLLILGLAENVAISVKENLVEGDFRG